MKTLGKCVAFALAAGMIPFRFRKDSETGSFEVCSLLWSVKKTAGKEQDNYTVELLPFVGS